MPPLVRRTSAVVVVALLLGAPVLGALCLHECLPHGGASEHAGHAAGAGAHAGHAAADAATPRIEAVLPVQAPHPCGRPDDHAGVVLSPPAGRESLAATAIGPTVSTVVAFTSADRAGTRNSSREHPSPHAHRAPLILRI